MTTKADERISRIESALDRLEALGLTGPPPTATPASVNPDGSPGHVAAGELIESAWGNAVADEFQRQRSWHVQVQTGVGPVGTTRQDFPGLAVAVTFQAGRVYRVSTFLPTCERDVLGVAWVYLVSAANTILNTGTFTATTGDRFSMFATWLVAPSTTATDTIRVQLQTNTGVVAVTGGVSQQSSLLIEELSP